MVLAFRKSSRSHRFQSTSVPVLRSEEHTSELQSRSDLVCRLLLEKKKKTTINIHGKVIHTTDKPMNTVTRPTYTHLHNLVSIKRPHHIHTDAVESLRRMRE